MKMKTKMKVTENYLVKKEGDWKDFPKRGNDGFFYGIQI